MNIREARLTVLHTWLRLAWATGLALGLLFSPAPIVPPAAADSAGATVDAGTLPYTVYRGGQPGDQQGLRDQLR